jgi:dTDP-4-amino-4,6-dideoxygalactose transaminase
LNIDEEKIERAISERTRAICVVHYAGVACEMDTIEQIATDHSLHLIEDAAQGVDAYYRGRALGSIAPLGAFSFHSTKNFTCGEGGAVCINDAALIEHAEIIREKGTNRNKFLRGEVDKYTWVEIGSSYVLSEILAAFLFGQLEMLDAISNRRREIYSVYERELAPLAEAGLLQLPQVPADCQTNCHMFYLLVQTADLRDALLNHLKKKGVHAAFHYVPLHVSVMGRRLGYNPGDLPVTEDISGRLLRLPFFNEITIDEQSFVAEQIRDFISL